MSKPTSGLGDAFQVKSPFRLPWYKDKSYLTLSVLSILTFGTISWSLIKRDLEGRQLPEWAGTGPKTMKRADTDISPFREAFKEREEEEKRNRFRRELEEKRRAKFAAEGHTHEN